MQKGGARRVKAEDLINRTIEGYRLHKVLGRGGMSVVFLAQRLENLQEQVAIKILMPSDLSTAREFANFQARFLREALAVQQLHHEHILPVLDYGEEDGFFYMLMPVVSSGSLAHQLSPSDLLPLDTIARYLNQLASAVDYANRHGMVHRDIKPSNVLLDEQGQIYLADFGIVRLFDNDHLSLDQTPTTLTSTGQIYGTPAYMAPERFQGEPAEPATELPFDADNPIAVGMKHLNAEPVRPSILRPDLPAPAEAAILKALAKKPAERFASAPALAAAFEAGLKGEWVQELQPSAFAFAEIPTEKQVKQPVAAAASLEEITQPNRLMPASARGTQQAFAPILGSTPGAVRPESHFWRNLQIFAFVLLGLVLLLFVGVLGFAVYKLGTPAAPTPSIQTQPTSTTTAGSTPTRSSAVTPTAGSTPTSAPTKGTTPTPAPTPTVGTTPAPTPGTTPTSVPTAGSTP